MQKVFSGQQVRTNLCALVLKIATILLVIALTFIIAGCGKRESTSQGEVSARLTEYTILFVCDREGNQEICSINLSNMAVTNLTRNKASDVSPSWWPQKRMVIFGSSRSGQGDIYAMNPDGSDPAILVGGPNTQHSPVLSPDGKTLAYVELVEDKPQIRLRDMESANDVAIVNVSGPASNPAWSPDGRRLSFDGVPSAGAGWLKEVIYIMDTIDPSAYPKMVSHPDPDVHGYVESYWHPDGKTLVYVSGFGANRGLVAVDLSTKTGKIISEGLGHDRYPSVTPDGKAVACVSNLSEASLLGFLKRFLPGSRAYGLVLVDLETLQREKIVRRGVGLDRPVWVKTVDFR